VHLGVEKEFQPARKAHPAFAGSGRAAASCGDLGRAISAAGFEVMDDEPLAG